MKIIFHDHHYEDHIPWPIIIQSNLRSTMRVFTLAAMVLCDENQIRSHSIQQWYICSINFYTLEPSLVPVVVPLFAPLIFISCDFLMNFWYICRQYHCLEITAYMIIYVSNVEAYPYWGSSRGGPCILWDGETNSKDIYTYSPWPASKLNRDLSKKV